MASIPTVMPPRPILKRTPSHPPSDSARPRDLPVVHFPPSPALTRTFSAHSPSTYDRSPIIVAPNSCALPERGCPGRTYVLGDSTPTPCSNKPRRKPTNGHVHPRALSRHKQQQGVYVDGSDEEEAPSIPGAPVPSLIPDTTSSSSSESDESDSLISPPLESIPFYATHSRTLHGLVIPQSSATKSRSSSDTLAFLPHPPSPPEDNKGVRPRRSSPSSRRRSLRDVTVVEEDTAYHEKKPRNFNCLSKAMSGLGMDDDAGCLAGF